jgi:hypothetical protein
MSPGSSALLLFLTLFGLPLAGHTRCLPPPAELTQNIRLEAGCTYHQGIRISHAVTLDCAGAVFDGGGTLTHGLVIDSRGETLSGVMVRNCSFRNFSHDGVLIHWGLPNAQKLSRYPDPDEPYRRAPQDILLENVRVEANAVMGIAVDDYVQRVTLDHVAVIDNPGWGIYWDNASRGNRLLHSEVRGNGHGTAFGKPGLSIDASTDNQVIDTRFENNGRAGIALYRNCQELAASNPDSIPRETGANRNLILGNSFRDEAVGIWLAARQSQDVSRMQCGRPAYAEGRYVEDEARENVIARNHFKALRGHAILVEDDANALLDNQFEHGTNAILIGTPIRSRVLQHPVRDTLLHGNAAGDGIEPVHLLDAD